jgi:glucose/arabinose dehydrogenase
MKLKNSIPLSLCLVFLFTLISESTGLASRQAEPNWPRLGYKTITGGLDRPVYITHAGDGSERLFVVEQVGRIRIVKDGAIQSTFLDITDRVRSPENGGGNEEGLLSVAFPTGFGTDKDYFYVYYTFSFNATEGYNRVSRFYLGDDGLADPNSEEQVMLLEHPGHENHNGGQLAFGPDGYLYIATGDGGGRGDPDQNAQNPASLLGKILRIDVESGTDPYLVPLDNPFVSDPGYRPEIWALGLRNPWRVSFDRQTGDMFIGDVGQANWEEVDFQPSTSPGGENYGWNILEGTHCYEADTCDDSGMTPPVFEYPTHAADHCAVTGGYMYRGPIPGFQGIYIFADLCSGKIWGLQNAGSEWFNQVLFDTDKVIPTFGEDQAGNLYFTDLVSGEIYMITEANATFLPLIVR